MTRLARSGAALVALNLLLFLGTATLILDNVVPVSHHWLIPLHELILLGLAAVWRPPAPRAATGLSLLILGVSVARTPTIYLSHHYIHFAMTWALATVLHHWLGANRAAPWGAFNRRMAWLCAVVTVIATTVAVRHGIWWGLCDGT